ncbi:spore cortex biosynthesis protein YabQ [Irregularibacter muris]|uniref:Spore cortex biosynthesis protein YabQ n=1 Tax=Irregularibacter muris TaxID=1796619 RepID=A0AAE3HH65_9FIRM|nr:spore cortex biosynthesis protein YabQ [Irregularibacter muris]MCR1899038.1 spore cortex biosynthesis protein YabQ [Irregularibacter muris]
MEENIRVQIYVFLFTLYGGLIIGIVYDLIDMLLNGGNKKTKGRGIKDILFWMVSVIIVLGVLFYSNNGIVRVYTLLGFATGWLLYFWLLSPWIRKIIQLIIEIFIRILKIIIMILIIPCKWIKKALYLPVMRVNNKIRRGGAKIKKYFNIPKIVTKQYNKYKGYLGRKK